MDEVNEQMAVRRQKMAKLDAQGFPVYPNDFRPTHTVQAIRNRHGRSCPTAVGSVGQEFKLAGRIRAFRPHGKAAFFEIEDGTGRLQVYARKDKLGEEAYERVRSLDVGDIAGVRGRLLFGPAPTSSPSTPRK